MRAVALASPVVTATPTVLLTLASCSDTASVIVTEGALPAEDDPAWQPCTTRPIPYTVNGEGAHTLRVWGRDALGNPSSAAAEQTVTLDTTPPLIGLTTFTGGEIAGGPADTLDVEVLVRRGSLLADARPEAADRIHSLPRPIRPFGSRRPRLRR